MLTQNLLNEVADALNLGAANYTVFLRLYTKFGVGRESLAAIVKSAVSERVQIEAAKTVQPAEMVEEIVQLLSYPGGGRIWPGFLHIGLVAVLGPAS